MQPNKSFDLASDSEGLGAYTIKFIHVWNQALGQGLTPFATGSTHLTQIQNASRRGNIGSSAR